MPPKTKISKEKILEIALLIVKEEGISSINARNIAKRLHCSTQPIFRNYKNMSDLNNDLKKAISEQYDVFINEYINKNHTLFTMSYAYVEFAREERNYFEALFLRDITKIRSVDQIINSSWNRETILSEVDEFNISLEKAEELYRDVRFYTFGIATQVYAQSLSIKPEDVKSLIHNAIDKFVRN